jgi:lysozyme
MVINDRLKRWIKTHEGFNNMPYKDSVGKLTIGWGRNIEDMGITKEEAEIMLENDINRCIESLQGFKWYKMSPDSVKYALINMCFNMGISRLLLFKKMIEALLEKNYTKAAMEALNSKWAEQVGRRATDVAVMIREGE